MNLVYNIPMGQPFLRQLAAGLISRFGDHPLQMGEVVVLLPTRRGCLSLKEIFREAAREKTLILPRIYALADLEKEPILPGFLPDFTAETFVGQAEGDQAEISGKVISRWERLGHLTYLVQAFLQQKHLCYTPAVAYPLAQELATLLDEFYISGVSLGRLETLVTEDISIYWQQNLDFLRIISDYWPRILKEKGLVEAAQLHQQNLRLIATQWRPEFPVILAGTTGTRPATAELARALLRCPQGMVVLPGFDPDCQGAIEPTHPNYTLTRFIDYLEVPRTTIQPWCTDTYSFTGSIADTKVTLLKQAMAPVLTMTDKLSSITADELPIIPISCSTPDEEALVIAAIMRSVYEEDKGTAALITPDQGLTRRVQAYLKRWDIIPNVSAGTPLHETVVGTFLNLITNINPEMTITDWVALLKHPLFFKKDDREAHLAQVRQLEREVLRQKRGMRPNDDSVLPEALQPWYRKILDIVKPLFQPLPRRFFPEWLALHCDIAFQLGGIHLWHHHDGEAAQNFLEELRLEATAFPAMSWKDYALLLRQLMGQVAVHNKEGIGSPLRILGTLEARQTEADIMILAGLNEAVWPQAVDEGAWLSNKMRLRLGLPSVQRRLGLSAHDFCLGFAAKEVYLTRSEQSNGSTTVPSRLWLRLQTILKQYKVRCEKAESLLTMVRALDRSEEIKQPLPPQPQPPAALKPKHYSITDIERLLRDPYSIYAKKILKLRKLEPLDQPLTGREWGSLVHQVLDLTFQRHHPREEEKFVAAMKQIGQHIFAPYFGDVTVQTFWWHRFEQICDWIGQMKELKDVQVFYPEVRGQIDLRIGDDVIELATVVDRIDQFVSGECQLVDYKTGTLPTEKDISLGFSPQMALEGVILQQGGFAGVEGVDLKAVYWALQGGVEGGTVKPVKSYKTLVEEAALGVQELLAWFHKDDAIYFSCPWGEDKARLQDYRHLARIDEWMI